MNDIKSIIFDEIALEGLDGITIESLWIRLKDSNFKLLNLDDLNSKIYIWKNVILKFANNNFKFYELPDEREPIQIFNRYDQVSQETGYCIYNEDQIPDSCRVDIFPINTSEERGSCKYYKERKLIDLNKISDDLNVIMKEYGNKLVIVANQFLRENSLRINYSDPHVDLSPTQYCLMERIGYCRKYGELTFGKESANFKEPPKTLFYFRKLLLKKGLITKQTHTIYNSKTLSISRGLLLMLPRFHIERKTYIEKGAIRLIEILKTKPNYKLNYLELKAETKMRNKPFKQIFAEYHKNFRLTEESVKINNKTVKTKFVQLIKSFEEETESEEEDDLEDDNLSTTIKPNSNKIEMFSPDSIVVNSPLLAQSRNVVDLFSTANGISLREFQQQLVVPRLDARMLVRMLERLGEIETISTMNGRQKITKYFLKNNVNNQVTAFNNENNQLDLGGNGKATLIQLKRARLILNAVKEHKIIDQLIYFKKLILESEKNLPYSVDQKSIKRILGMLAKEKKLNWFKCTIDKDNLVRKINLITIPTITEDDDVVKERFEQAKFKYGSFLNVDNNGQQNLHQELSDHSWVLNLNSHKNDDAELIYQPSIGRKYGLEPKMKKIITFYQFIFFTLSDQCKKNNDFNDWRKHITPLPKSYEKDTCLLGDLIPRIPLSIFAKVVFITFIIPGLQEILNDPVKCNYTLQMLPPDIVKNLFRKRKYIFDMVELLTLLTYLNLVKIESRHLSMKESVSIKLLKTTQFIEDDYIKNYKFDCLNDIELFSNDLALHGSRTDCKNCTFDSRLYIHNPRNWSYLPKIHRNQIKEIKRFARLKNVTGDSIDQSYTTKSTRKRKSTISRPTKRLKKTKSTNTNESTAKEKLPKSIRKKGYDKDDINALSLLRKQRCEWSKEEDSFLLMCRVASILLNPNSINFVCVHKKVLRDQLHQYLPNISLDKTSKACQRRLMYMLKNPTTRAHVLDWVAECKQDAELISIKRPNVPLSHEAEWNKQFISLLHTLLKKFQNEHFIRPLASLEKFRTLEDIYRNYDLIESEIHCVPQKPILYFQPNNIVDIYVNVVLNVLSSSLLINLYDNSEEYNTKSTLALFKIYQRYPDTMIRAVVNKMKQNGMMAKLRGFKNRNTDSNFKIQKSNDKNNKKLAFFKISQHYCYMLRSKFSMDNLVKPIALKTNDKIEEFIPTNLAFITNLLNMNRIKFKINLPDNFVSFKDNFNASTTTSNDKASSTINSSDKASVSSYSDVIEHFNLNKRVSRFVLCSLRQKLDNNLNEKVQSQPDYLNLNGCQISCQTLNVNNLINLKSFLELLNKQEKFIKLDNDIVQNIKLDTLEKSLIKEVMKFKDIGINYNHLAENLKLKNIDDEIFKEKIDKLCDRELLFEVGVEEVRYVTYKYVSSWLVHAQLPLDEKIILENSCYSDKTLNENEIIEVNQDNLSNQSIDNLVTISQSTSQTTLIESTTLNESNQNIHNESALPIATTSSTTLNQTDLPSTSKSTTLTKSIYSVESSKQFIKSDVICFIPKFWKTPFGKLDKRIILMFLIGVLGHVMAYPGIKHEDLISYFKFCLPPLQTIDIIELLIASNCIKKEEKIVEYKYSLFDEPEKQLLVYYEPTKQSFINICLIKNKLEQ